MKGMCMLIGAIGFGIYYIFMWLFYPDALEEGEKQAEEQPQETGETAAETPENTAEETQKAGDSASGEERRLMLTSSSLRGRQLQEISLDIDDATLVYEQRVRTMQAFFLGLMVALALWVMYQWALEKIRIRREAKRKAKDQVTDPELKEKLSEQDGLVEGVVAAKI